MRGDDAIFDNFLFVVDVVEEKVERGDALDESAFEKFPFLGRDDARHEVERKNAFGAARIAIDVERYALAQKREINGIAFGVKIVFSQAIESGLQLLVMAQNASIAAEHFVEKAVYMIVRQQRAGRCRFYQ